MRLELADFPVNDVHFEKNAGYDNGVLLIDKDELIKLVMQDSKIASADVDIARPGERTRIVYIRDVVEPRIKVTAPGCVFPGILGPVETVGHGRTHRLSGVTVMVSARYRRTIPSGSDAECSGLVDMWGPGLLLTPFGSMMNVVLSLKLIDGVTEIEAHTAIQLAEFKVAHRLAEATKTSVPQRIEIFELSKVNPSLPRVLYVLEAMAMVDDPSQTNLFFYGFPVKESLPTLIHPNELLDGALTCNARHGGASFVRTWNWMNNAILFELYREHGERINFIGVILQRTRFATEHGKQVAAESTSQMARLLNADGAIITESTPSGSSFTDTMLTLTACEEKGVKTVLLTPEWGAESGTSLPFYVSEATALVSSGVWTEKIRLSAPDRVLGVEEGELVTPGPEYSSFFPMNEILLDNSIPICGGIDWLGHMRNSCIDD